MAAPYDHARQDGFGELYFIATFPAFKKLGARFGQVRESAGQDERAPDEKRLPDVKNALRGRAQAVEQRLLHGNPELHQRLVDKNLLGPLRDGPAGGDPGAIEGLLDEVTAAGTEGLAARGIPVMPFDEEALKADFEAAERDFEADERPTQLPHGTVCVVCGETERMTKKQRALFQWLDQNQDQVVRNLSEALRVKYIELLPGLEQQHRAKAGQRPFLPAVVRGDEADDLFVIREIHLHSKGPDLGFVVQCAFHDDAPVGVLLTDGEIADIGPVDVAYVNLE